MEGVQFAHGAAFLRSLRLCTIDEAMQVSRNVEFGCELFIVHTFEKKLDVEMAPSARWADKQKGAKRHRVGERQVKGCTMVLCMDRAADVCVLVWDAEGQFGTLAAKTEGRL